MKVNVLGTDYTIVLVTDAVDKRLAYIDGFCDDTTKEIYVDNYEAHQDEPHKKSNLDVQIKKNIRHELVHAFLFESGLAENSPWAQNEELVDWIAIQGPKLWKAWQEAGAV
ncbi:basic secretory protein-like protein [Acutalibacter sp. JLR.KK004]|uniref:basic secretory protein-like protein n=1 Tax=Acutalibacter sp. JLR.KK004 TaxID=3112622 RepID=UPI002FF1C9F7